MTIQEKMEILQGLKTAEIVNSIHAQEKELEGVMREQVVRREEYAPHIKGGRTNSETVTNLEAGLAMETPDEIAGKKLTAPEKAAWLKKQRTENKELADAYSRQKMAETVIADLDIRRTMAEVRLSNLKAILAMRAAQITFLAGDVRIQINETEELIKKES